MPRYCELIADGVPGYADLVRAIAAGGGYDPPAAPQPASLGQTVLNFAGAMWRWGRSGLVIVTQDDHDARMALCEAPCEHWRPAFGQCRLCGCLTAEKSWLATEECPIQKWRATAGPKKPDDNRQS